MMIGTESAPTSNVVPFKEVGETHLSQAIQQSRSFAIKPVIIIEIGTHRTRTKRVAGKRVRRRRGGLLLL